MSEGHEEESTFPPGFRFTPTDSELIDYYLLPRLQGRPCVPNAAVIDDYVYSYHPDDLLKGEYKKRGQDDTWYFLSPRIRKYANGDRPSRCTDDRRGRWKVSTARKPAVTLGNVKYSYSVLNYYEGPTYKDEDKGEWMMRELTVPEYENKLDGSSNKRKTLDEYVVCKIYLTTKGKKNKNKVDEAGPSGTSEEPCPAASLPGPVETTGQDTAKPILKRQKRKRPAEAATPKQAAPAPPPSDRCVGPQAGGPSRPTQSLYGVGGVQTRFGTTGYHPHYGGTGRPPMPYNPHASMPPRPPVAFTGHYQVPGYRAAPVASPCNSAQTMMGRHLGPAGQSFRPPRPPTVPSHPVTQRQPETEEMRQMRVYQQHINELTRMHGRGMMPQQQQQSGNVGNLPAQQPRPNPFMQQQQPYFGPGLSGQYVRPMAPPFLPCNYHQPVEFGQQVQCSSAVADIAAATTTTAGTDAGNVGATNQGSLRGGFD